MKKLITGLLLILSIGINAQVTKVNELVIKNPLEDNVSNRKLVIDSITGKVGYTKESQVITDHNDLNGLQGGSENDRQHLTTGEKEDIIQKNSTPQTKLGGLTIGINNSKPSDSWIALGTSVTFLNNYTSPASSQMNLIQINHGVSGSTSNDLINHYSEIPTLNSGNENQYRLLSIEHGINDAAQSVPLATFRANLESCIADAKAKNWPNNKILIINANYCNPSAVPGLADYAAEAILIAKEQGVQYYDTYNYTFNNGALTLLSDGIHPTAAGGIIYARGLVASMQGGMEITNALTVDNQIVTNGIKVISGNAQIGPSSGSSGRLIVSGDLTSTEPVARGINVFTNHIAGVNNQRLIGLDISPTFSANGFTGTQFIGINLNDIARIERQTNNTATIFKFTRTDNSQSSFFGHSGTGNFYLTKALAVGSDLIGFPNTSGNLYVFNRAIINSNIDDTVNRLQVNGTVIATGYNVTGTLGFLKSNGTVDTTSYAPLLSPTFTGDPKAPTPTAGDNDTSIATTAFVNNVLSSGNYTPTLTASTNITSLVLTSATYSKIGNIVTARITVGFSTTAGNTASIFSFTLPISKTTSNAVSIGEGSSITASSTSGSIDAITQSSTTTCNASFIAGAGSGLGGKATVFIQYNVLD